MSNRSVDVDRFENVRNEVEEVGIAVCASCHKDIYESYIQTGMGQSFGLARKEISDARFGDHALVYDRKNDFYYKPFFKDSVYYIQEFRLNGKDTVHSRTEQIDFIVGSGHHTNSHIIDENGYLTQAPITFYTQKGVWDMAPGFENNNLRFERILKSECLTCHNHYPSLVEGANSKYDKIPLGIECERCHGPGKLHVERMLAGEQVDTARAIDYSIVNPSHLPSNLQMDICQRCHLQGVAVLNEDKTFYDFKPGMQLSEVMHVFLPRFTDSDENFIMASQADRFRMSKCFTESESISCITCHNPHKSVQSTSLNVYNDACQNCHHEKTSLCSVEASQMSAMENNCVGCHMPPSHSIDIPHVSITDHYISKENTKYGTKAPKLETSSRSFLGLSHLTKDQPLPIDMAQGYLALYDKFIPDQQMLDSAFAYLSKSESSQLKNKVAIHYYFTKEAYKEVCALADEVSSFKDAWTNYRIGESFMELNKHAKALIYLKKASNTMPLNLDFLEKLGVCYMRLDYIKEATTTFEKIIDEYPKRPLALTNLGYIEILQNNLQKALAYYQKAIQLDPDLEQANLNIAALHILNKEKDKAKYFLERTLAINPDNEQARIQ
ncbi:MAG: tetratricopeptide repeat protein, partial [Bacteroidota bacterium]